MEDEKDAFYVVRKGDVVGVYTNLKDCQAQLESSAGDPSVSVLKGYCLPKEAEKYLASQGLKGATYSISATDVQNCFPRQLVACPFQDVVGSTSSSAIAQGKPVQFDNQIDVPAISSNGLSCILEFDGASKGNPGLSGAGAVIRAEDGNVCRLREGVGIATSNVAEYRALILGLKYALKKGFKHIRVQGDSKLVCMQIQGLWKTKNHNMATLCTIAKEFKDKFASFQIKHVERDFNSDADDQANHAVFLKDGEVREVDEPGKIRGKVQCF